MVTWTWQTRPDGIVTVARGGEPGSCIEFQETPAASGVEVLLLPAAPAYDKVLAKVGQWAALAAPLALAHGVPLSWVLAFMYAEGGGDPQAELHEPDGSVGVGLMALTAKPEAFPAKFGISFEEAHQPGPNLSAGIAFMKKTMDQAPARDVVELASSYNCGFTPGQGPRISTRSPWGLCEFCGRIGQPTSCCHIERVVRANNTFITRGMVAAPGPGPGPAPPDDEPPPVLAAAAAGAPGGPFAWLLAATASFALVRWLKKKKP